MVGVWQKTSTMVGTSPTHPAILDVDGQALNESLRATRRLNGAAMGDEARLRSDLDRLPSDLDLAA